MAPPPTRHHFRIAIICALAEEKEAVEALFEEVYPLGLSKHHKDQNVYSLGKLGGQPVVLACLRGMGKRFSTGVAHDLKYSFESIELAFVVGITGCAPFNPDGSQTGVRLGDIIISTSMLEYDFGKQHENRFEITMTHQRRLSKPAERVQTFLKAAQGKRVMRALTEATNQPLQETQLSGKKYESPGRINDHIFRSDYIHKHQRAEDCKTCARWTKRGDLICFDIKGPHISVPSCDELGCMPGKYDLGADREHSEIFFGPYVSGSGVMKSAHHRDLLVKAEQRPENEALAIEMEGSGVWDTFPTMVVKGVVDYADSHKNKRWRLYPAARAALCAAQIIREMDMGVYMPVDIETSALGADNPASNDEKARRREEEVHAFRVSLYNNTSNYEEQRSIYMARANDTCQWICDDYRQVQSFLNGSGPRLLWISGHAGCGKCYIAAFLTERLQHVPGNIVCHYFLNPSGENPDTALRILCALLHQLCVHRRASYAAYDVYQSFAKGNACLAELKAVWQMICAAAAAAAADSPEQNVYLCIDGLDQCSKESMESLVNLLTLELNTSAALYEASKAEHARSANLRILIVSRPEDDVTARLGRITGCCLELEGAQSVVQQDLEAIVSHRVAELQEYHRFDQELGKFIKHILLKQAGSTFLWIKVVCSRLNAVKRLNEQKVQSIVQSSPRDLDLLYAEMLNCEEDDIELTRAILHMVMAAAEPLSVDALNLAVSIRVSDARLEQVEADKNFERTLRQLCGSLLTISKQKSVTFLHQTVSDFLTKGTHLIGEGTHSTLFLDAVEAQCQLASKCMVYLLLRDFEGRANFQQQYRNNRRGSISKMLDRKHSDNGIKKGALFHYAASHWQTHFAVYDQNRNIDPSEGDRNAVKRLLDPEYMCVWSAHQPKDLSGVLDWAIRQNQTVMTLILVKSRMQAIAKLPPEGSILASCARYDSTALLETLYNQSRHQLGIWSERNLTKSLHVSARYNTVQSLTQLLRYAESLQQRLSSGTVRELLCDALNSYVEASRPESCVEVLLQASASTSDPGTILEHEGEPDQRQCPVCVAATRGNMQVLRLFDAFQSPLDLYAVGRAIDAVRIDVSGNYPGSQAAFVEFVNLLGYLAEEDGGLLTYFALRQREEPLRILTSKFGPDYDERVLARALVACLMDPYISRHDVVFAIHPDDYRALQVYHASQDHNIALVVVERLLQQVLAVKWQEIWPAWERASHPEDKADNSWCGIINLLLSQNHASIPDWLWAGMLHPSQVGNVAGLLLQGKFVLPDHLWPMMLLSCAQHLDHATGCNLFHKYTKSQSAKTSPDIRKKVSFFARILNISSDLASAVETNDDATQFIDIDVLLDANDFTVVQDVLLANCQLIVQSPYEADGEIPAGKPRLVKGHLRKITPHGGQRNVHLSIGSSDRTRQSYLRQAFRRVYCLTWEQMEVTLGFGEPEAEVFHRRLVDHVHQSAQSEMDRSSGSAVPSCVNPFPVRLKYTAHLSALSWALGQKKFELARTLISQHNVDVWHESDKFKAMQHPTLLEQVIAAGLQDEVIAWVLRNRRYLISRDSAGATILHYVARRSATSTDIGARRTLCLDHKASIQARDNEQQTPLDYARAASQGQESPAMLFLLDLSAQCDDNRDEEGSGSDFDIRSSGPSEDDFGGDLSEDNFGSDLPLEKSASENSDDCLGSAAKATTLDGQIEIVKDTKLTQVGRLMQFVTAAEKRARRQLPV